MTEKNMNRAQAVVFGIAALHVVAIAVALLRHAAGGADLVPAALVPHLVLAVLLPVRALKLRTGRPKARVVLTLVLAVQLVAAVAGVPGYDAWALAIQACSVALEVAALALLWVPGRQQVALGR
ncbi:hypothetical protein [Dactylosporangium darangshiense]|uniref:Integral membrane protein n=1 Tax=Dactylosporangium darangshiense TaxID=579108 RepID=A0ABP8DJM6_9ACTN